jgi:hypothetical protein
MKPSFRQRFVSLDLDYLPAEDEAFVVAEETGVGSQLARQLVHVATSLREAAREETFDPPSTRTLVTAARLIVKGLRPRTAIHAAILEPLLSGNPVDTGLRELIAALLPE